MTWHWLSKAAVLAIRGEHLAEHGGAEGIRDENLFESALARPGQLAAYGDEPDAADLAGAYAHGIARNYPFVDGNKRTAFVVAAAFSFLTVTIWRLRRPMSCARFSSWRKGR